jgi:hypothetical protein
MSTEFAVYALALMPLWLAGLPFLYVTWTIYSKLPNFVTSFISTFFVAMLVVGLCIDARGGNVCVVYSSVASTTVKRLFDVFINTYLTDIMTLINATKV